VPGAVNLWEKKTAKACLVFLIPSVRNVPRKYKESAIMSNSPRAKLRRTTRSKFTKLQRHSLAGGTRKQIENKEEKKEGEVTNA